LFPEGLPNMRAILGIVHLTLGDRQHLPDMIDAGPAPRRA